MGEFSAFLDIIDAGGSVGIFALLFVMWKFDRRLLIIELFIKSKLKGDKDDV